MKDLGRIVRRKMNFSFSKTVRHHWMNGDAFKTHFLNSFTLLFPEGEKFFIRSINRFKGQIKDPEISADIKDFIFQETQHYLEHQRFFTNLEEQGYEIQPMIKFLKFFISEVVEKFSSDKMNLSITSGLEHITAMLSEIALETGFLNEADGEMRELFEWHAREEIEHRHVAYDVLNAVDDSYSLRVMGLVIAYILFGAFTTAFTIGLLKQDKKIASLKTLKSALQLFITKESLFYEAGVIMARYLLPNFHPNNRNSLDELLAKFEAQARAA
ncbi:MAG: metal-dependent hydrolase [Bacteriovoracaceae bacterium]